MPHDAKSIQNRIIDLSSDLYDFADRTQEPLMMVALAARLLWYVTEAATRIDLNPEQQAEFDMLLRAVDRMADASIAAARAEMADELPPTERVPQTLDPKLN